MAQSNFLTASLDAQKRQHGESNVFMASEGAQLSVGIPLPSFSVMYLLDLDVLPLGRILGVAGPPASQKSSFAFEVVRWLMGAEGEAKLVECEGGKYSPKLMRSIIGNKGVDEHFLIGRSDTIEEAQGHLSSALDLYEANPEAGMKSISALVVDSLVGVTSEAVMIKHVKDGHASPEVAIQAKGWSPFFKSYSSRIAGWPIVAVVVNHLKTKVNTSGHGGPPGRYTPGGDAQSFYAGLYLWMQRIASSERITIVRNGERINRFTETRRLKIELQKSSLGTDGREIFVNFSWYHDEEGNQVSYFDWNASTCELLLSMQGRHGYIDKQPADLCNLIDIDVSKGTGEKKYTSQALGLEGVSDSEIGAAIDSNPEWIDKLCKFFNITRHNKWTGVMPELEKKVKQRKKKDEVVANPDNRAYGKDAKVILPDLTDSDVVRELDKARRRGKGKPPEGLETV